MGCKYLCYNFCLRITNSQKLSMHHPNSKLFGEILIIAKKFEIFCESLTTENNHAKIWINQMNRAFKTLTTTLTVQGDFTKTWDLDDNFCINKINFPLLFSSLKVWISYSLIWTNMWLHNFIWVIMFLKDCQSDWYQSML